MPHGSSGEEDGDLPFGRVERDLRRGDLPTAFPGVDESEDVRVPDRLGVRLSFPRGDGDPQETGSLVVDHAHRPPVRDDDHPLRQVFQEGRKPDLLGVQLGHGPFQVGGRLVESRGNVFQFVARLQAQAYGTVSGGKLPGGFPDLFEGAGDVPGADGCAGQHQEKGRKPRPPGDRPDAGHPPVRAVCSSFPMRSPSAAIVSRSITGAKRSGRNISAARRAWFSRLWSTSSMAYLLNWTYPATPAKARAVPVITKYVRKNFVAMETRRRIGHLSGSWYPTSSTVRTASARNGIFWRIFAMWTSTVRSVTWVPSPQTLARIVSRERTRPADESRVLRMRNSFGVRGTGLPRRRTLWRGPSIRRSP